MGFGFAKIQMQTSQMPLLRIILSTFDIFPAKEPTPPESPKPVRGSEFNKRGSIARISLWKENAEELEEEIAVIRQSMALPFSENQIQLVATTGTEMHNITGKISFWVDEESDIASTNSNPLNSSQNGSLADKDSKPPSETSVVKEKTSFKKLFKFIKGIEFWLWFSFFSVSGIIIWSVLIYQESYPSITNRHNRQLFRSVALAPTGAWLRWGLARLPKLKALFPEINPQTLIANLLAVTLMCFLLVLAPDSEAVWVVAINNGNLL